MVISSGMMKSSLSALLGAHILSDMEIYEGELLTYREAGQRLRLHPDTIMRRAKRHGWERVEGNAKTDPVRIRVPASVLDAAQTSVPDKARRTPRMSADAVAPLAAALERQEISNKELQAALDAARAERALAQIDAAKADTMRHAAEKSAAELARRLETEETERRTFQGQTDALRAELSAAEIHVAELKTTLADLEIRLQAASKDDRDRTLWKESAAHRIRVLEHQLADAKIPGGQVKRWWWPF